MIARTPADGSRLYEQMADKLATMIAQGTLRPGDRVPSVRGLSKKQGVSVSTVLQAYMVLENRGLIEARPQSGFYVRHRFRALPAEPAKTAPSATASRVSVNELVTEFLRAVRDPQIVSLGAGCASAELFPTEKLNRVMASVARRSGAAGNQYDFAAGNPELRREVARRSLDWGCALSSEDIITTCGCMEALNLCLRAVAKPGDTVAVESPTFFGVLQMIGSLGMKALELPTYPRHGVCLDETEAALRRHKVAAVLLTPNYQNPLGACMPDEKKTRLIEILGRREIPLIEDDLFGDLPHEGNRPKVAKAFDKKGLVLLCSSYSKTLCPGYRVGWTAPGRFRDEVERLKFTNTIASPVLPQLAVAEFLRNGGYDHYLRRVRRSFAHQVRVMIDAVTKYFPEGTKVTRPTGGFLLWVEFPKWVDSLRLYRVALNRKISITPGPLFSPKQGYRNFIRLSCGQVWSDEIEQAVITLGKLAEKQQ
jgi:DNA-binding transcriptional MocR family regulator